MQTGVGRMEPANLPTHPRPTVEPELDDLRRSEARLHAVIDSSPLAIMEVDLESRVIGWNPAAEIAEAELQRLNAELQARLEELAASRARIVAAGDIERRRLERNLHDGARFAVAVPPDRARETRS
jgi:PAS domain S-box-containing protein